MHIVEINNNMDNILVLIFIILVMFFELYELLYKVKM
jgi:hypothetical protein